MSQVIFTLNGKQHTLTSLDADTTLNSYIRNHANLRGTKAMCHEGGCGACIVSVTLQHPVTKKQETIAVNSCLVSVFSCHNWDIMTIEGIGNKLIGYHKIQERLATFNGTQCGYCSPGFVMNMYSLRSNKEELTMKEVENSFGSNICRCTGYRSIADAFKSFAKDVPPDIRSKIRDIEDLSSINFCKQTGTVCTKTCDDYSVENDWCKINANEVCKVSNFYGIEQNDLEITSDKISWFKVYNVKNILSIINKEGVGSYKLVAGNTAQGVVDFKERVTNVPNVMIDISSVAELRNYNMDVNLEIGSGMTLTELMNLFLKMPKTDEYFEYTKQFYNHIDLVAHIPVRNVGTIGGNLMIKYQQKEFPSDIFLMFEAVGAIINIVDIKGKKNQMTLSDFLHFDMHGKIIYSVNLPPLSDEYKFKSYKIMRRAQNTHALVNAGFLLKIVNNKIESARIVFGNINPDFIHATQTEKLLTGKNIFTNSVLQGALQALNSEIIPNVAPPEPGPLYRKKLAVGLFYKYILSICPKDKVNPRYVSGGMLFDRPVSSGKQEFTTKNEEWPIYQPMPKLEALTQTSGEATYCNDIPTLPNEVYAAFVLATEFGGEIDEINADEALKMKGVVQIFVASDIPGQNTFTPLPSSTMSDEEEIFCSGKIKYHGQPVALIVAQTEKLAHIAALKVKVTYKNKSKKKPLLNVRDVIADPNEKDRITNVTTIEPKSRGNNTTKVIKGSMDLYSQYHYTMETQTTVCVPMEDCLDVYSATQWIDYTQQAISAALDIPESRINIPSVKRLGGGYGAKISRSVQVATACALAAHKLNQPVRFVLSIEENLKSMGKRLSCSNIYEVGVDDNGKIQYLNTTYYEDSGCSSNESLFTTREAGDSLGGCYDRSTWYISGYAALTDTPSTTWCRGPGSTEGVAMGETILEHISIETGKDPVDVRLANMSLTNNPLPDMINSFIEKTEYRKREKNIQEFNSKNRWRKRGINLIPMKYSLNYFGNYAAHVSIFHGDGSVAVCHGGIEMGQGINTKVAQVTARTLGIPLEMVSIKPSNSFVTPNANVSGGSQTSELCCLGAKRACENILARMADVKKELNNPTWLELVTKANEMGKNLAENYLPTEEERKSYDIWGVTVTEVEIDVLTGVYEILRVDILEDTGESLNPDIDIGQIEGAYIMGLGYWTCEGLEYDKDTGALLTNRTWNYKTPGLKDVPIDLRVDFRNNSPNSLGVLRSKATGEPPLNMAYGVVLALRRAITAAVVENGSPGNEWYPIVMPVSQESVLMAIKTNLDQYVLAP